MNPHQRLFRVIKSVNPAQTVSYEMSQGSSQPQEILHQRSNDIYQEHLILKGRGFPLWIPAPSQTLHIEYRRTGIHIGDVGIITRWGEFSFLFNICFPRDDPENSWMLPENFVPISWPIEATIVKSLVFGKDNYLASASVNRSQTDIGISFESSASEGAILTMPRGARSKDLGNFARFREYAAANVADWYKFVNGVLGCEAQNGDIRLVVGSDKTTSWGMATFANQTKQSNCRLRFRPLERVGLTHPNTYTWDYSGAAEVRVGPDLDQDDSLRINNDPPDVQFENQCLFMRTLNITLADDVWADIQSSSGSVDETPQYSRSSIIHPSKVLNDILLEKIPTAKMAITHDNDWSSFITQYDTFPDSHEVTMNILSSRNICEENGVIFLGSITTTPALDHSHQDKSPSQSLVSAISKPVYSKGGPTYPLISSPWAVTKVGIAFFTGPDQWAVVLCPGYYFSSQTWVYEIVLRKNSVWYRRDHNSSVEHEQGYRGLLHVGDIDVSFSVLHGRMQTVYSGIGRGHPNPTLLPWGKRPWVIRVLLILQQEYVIELPKCASSDLVRYIESRITSLSRNIIPLIG